MNIFIVGITGVGKSLLGKRLARSLNVNFIDLDAYIQVREKKTVSELFEVSQAHFRDAEQEALFHIPKDVFHVISTGGGIVMRSENISFMKEHGVIIYLFRDIDDIARNINITKKPLLKDRAAIYALYEERKPIYESCADICIDCTNKKEALSKMQNFVQAIIFKQLSEKEDEEGKGFNKKVQNRN